MSDILVFDWLTRTSTSYTHYKAKFLRNLEIGFGVRVSSHLKMVEKLGGIQPFGQFIRNIPSNCPKSKIVLITNPEDYFRKIDKKTIAHIRLILGKDYSDFERLLVEMGVFGDV